MFLGCPSVCPILKSWYLRNTLRGFLQVWHKLELIKFWWSKVKLQGHCDHVSVPLLSTPRGNLITSATNIHLWMNWFRKPTIITLFWVWLSASHCFSLVLQSIRFIWLFLLLSVSSPARAGNCLQGEKLWQTCTELTQQQQSVKANCEHLATQEL